MGKMCKRADTPPPPSSTRCLSQSHISKPPPTASVPNLVQSKGKMRVQLLQTSGDVSALLAPVYARHEEVDKPREAVLVHGLDVGQV